MAAKRKPESSLYPIVSRWLQRHFRCFKTAVNKGLRHGRIDVIGVRDIGGDLSGAIETIGVEVKRGAFPFANGCGQTLGYNVYVNRAYLADVREEGFTQDEIHIASHLGIGLIEIRRGRCREILSSPFYDPIEKLNLRLLEALRLGRCQFCASVFEIGSPDAKYFHGRLARENLKLALQRGKGLVFWNREVAERKRRLRLRVSHDNATYERRFICPDCVAYVFSQLSPRETAG
jgi:hypothetical protein